MRHLVKGFFCGFVCGAVAGWLLSPGRDEQGRSLLRQRVGEAIQAARQARLEHQERLLARYRQGIGLGES